MSGTGYAKIVLFDVSVDNRSLCGIWLVLRQSFIVWNMAGASHHSIEEGLVICIEQNIC